MPAPCYVGPGLGIFYGLMIQLHTISYLAGVQAQGTELEGSSHAF